MNWIKIERGAAESIECPHPILYTSNKMANQLKTQKTLQFGQKEISIEVKALPSIPENSGDDFDSPEIIQLTQEVIDELLIQTSCTYQIRISETAIKIGPVIGFLLGDQHYYYHHRRLKELTDAMGIYEKVGGLFVSFRYYSIDWNEKCIFGQYFNFINKRWEYGKLPLPSVVFRRGFHKRNNFVNEYKDKWNWKIFNEIRLDKWEMYSKLKDNEHLNSFLPETSLLTLSHLSQFLIKYSKVILKPKKLSRGRGISVLTRNPDGTIKIHDFRHFNDFTIPESELPEYLKKGKYLTNEYIIQPFLSLAKINNAPWDIRVVMQKNGQNQWICNGIECRLAPAGKIITNISGGGRALYLKEAVELAFGKEANYELIEKDIHSISMEFCKMMDSTGYHFAEFGLDIALDQQKHYWFIEANVRPTFKGFKHLNEKIYQQICFEPILYSAAISGFGRGVENESEI